MSDEFRETDGPALSDEQREYLKALMRNIAITIDACQEPLDSKALGLLEIAHDIIDQQLSMDVYHEWGPAMELDQTISKKDNGQKFLFLDNDNKDAGPSAEELEEWLGGS